MPPFFSPLPKKGKILALLVLSLIKVGVAEIVIDEVDDKVIINKALLFLLLGKGAEKQMIEERGKKVGGENDGKPITAEIGSCGNRQRQREPSCFEMGS